MNNPNNGKTHGREELKKFFRNGGLPSEQHFTYLIESMVNKEDDGFAKDEENGLHLSSSGETGRLMTFYTGIDEMTPMFHIDRISKDKNGIRLYCPDNTRGTGSNTGEPNEEEQAFFLQQGGKLGLGREAGQRLRLDVQGFVGMEGRKGTFTQEQAALRTIPANGKWQDIVTGLNGCQAFEVVARTGVTGSGRFAIVHAIAVHAFGRSWGRIRKTGSHFGFFWNRLNLRWRGTTHNYSLQLRTQSNFGDDIPIYYSITRLWDEEDVQHG